MKDANQKAFEDVRAVTDPDVAGPELLADIIGAIREGIAEGATDEDLALRLWPRLSRLVAIATAEAAQD